MNTSIATRGLGFIHTQAMLVEKFSSWIKRLHRDLLGSGDIKRQWGSQRELAERLGVDKGDMSKWLNSEAPIANPTLKTFERILWAARPGQDLMKTLEEIIDEKDIVKPPSKIFMLETRYRKAWERLFHGHPGRAERVLQNLEDQEELAMTETISKVVRTILHEGPQVAAGKVAGILNDAHETAEQAAKRKRVRNRRMQRYNEIG